MKQKLIKEIDWDNEPLPPVDNIIASELKNKKDAKEKRKAKRKKDSLEYGDFFEQGEDESAKKQQRVKRFQLGSSSSAPNSSISNISHGYQNGNSGGDADELDWDLYTVKGTSNSLEKQYLRLTSTPDPSTVRPENVLKKALAMVKQKMGSRK